MNKHYLLRSIITGLTGLLFFVHPGFLILTFLVYILLTPKEEHTHDYIPPDVQGVDKPSQQLMSPSYKRRYLQSTSWSVLRNYRLDKDNHKCAHCDSTQQLNVHHITYNNLGNEDPDKDLITLCQQCHNKLHNIAGYDRKGHYPVSILTRFNNEN